MNSINLVVLILSLIGMTTHVYSIIYVQRALKEVITDKAERKAFKKKHNVNISIASLALPFYTCSGLIIFSQKISIDEISNMVQLIIKTGFVFGQLVYGYYCYRHLSLLLNRLRIEKVNK